MLTDYKVQSEGPWSAPRSGYDGTMKETYNTAVDLRVRARLGPGDEGDRAAGGDARVGGERVAVLVGEQAAVVHLHVERRRLDCVLWRGDLVST